MAKVLWADNRSESSLLFCSFLPRCAYYIPLLCFPSFHKCIPKRLWYKPSPHLLCAMKVVWNVGYDSGQRAESSMAVLSSFTRASQKEMLCLEVEKREGEARQQTEGISSDLHSPTLYLNSAPVMTQRAFKPCTKLSTKTLCIYSHCLFVEPFLQDPHSHVRKENFALGWDSFHPPKRRSRRQQETNPQVKK